MINPLAQASHIKQLTKMNDTPDFRDLDRATKLLKEVRFELSLTRSNVPAGHKIEVFFNHHGIIYSVAKIGCCDEDTMKIIVYEGDGFMACIVPVEQANFAIRTSPEHKDTPPKPMIGFCERGE